MSLGAQVEGVLVDGRGGGNLFFEVMRMNDLKLIPGGHNRKHALAGCDEEVLVGDDW